MKFSMAPGALLLALISASPIVAKAATSRVLQKHVAPLTALAYAPDGKILASADESGRVILTDVASGQIKLSFRYKQKVAALAYSPDGKMLAVARAKEVRLLRPKTAQAIRVLKTQGEVGDGLGFSANSQRLIVTEGDSHDGAACSVWEVASGKRLQRHSAKGAESNLAALSPDGAIFAAPDASRTAIGISLWSVASGKRIRVLAEDATEKESPYINTVAFSPDGRFLAGLGFYFEASGHLTLWNAPSGKVAWGRTFHDTGGAIAWSPDSSRVAVGTQYDTTYDEPKHLHRPTGAPIFSAQSGQHWLSLQRTPHPVNAIAFAPDGQTLTTGSDDKTVRLWRLTK